MQDFPGGTVDKNLLANPGDMGSIPNLAHGPQLLKPVCLEPVLHNKRSHRSEESAHRNKE